MTQNLKRQTTNILIRKLLFCLVTIVGNTVFAQDFTKYVNPFIGTQGAGHTFPGAACPFGLVQVSPQTGNSTWDYCSGYQYTDTLVKGFANTQLSGTGIGDLGDVMMLPLSGSVNSFNSGRPISKKTEHAQPGYYAVDLNADGINVALTCTQRTALHRYTYNKGGESHILISIADIIHTWAANGYKVSDASFLIVNDSTIAGSYKSIAWVSRKVFFSIRLNKAFLSHHFMDPGLNKQLILDYDLVKGGVVEARIGISAVSILGATNNLEAESLGKSFKDLRNAATIQWNSYLSRVVIKGSQEQMINFYTSMYHLFIQPNNIADVDGRYRAADDKVYNSGKAGYYSTLSLWDTYRAAHPLYTILAPGKDVAIINSMLAHFDVAGYLPIWSLWGKDNDCMIGNHAVPVIVDACLKGLKGIDQERAYHAIKQSLTKNHWGKYDWTLYDKYGYLPSDTVRSEAVSRSLEANYDDWCAAQLAKKLGKQIDYMFFIKRAGFYKNLFDPSTGFMRGRLRNGSWVTPFNPLNIKAAANKAGDYTEANAWQYTWQVQHDPEGLVSLMGGKKKFAIKLDSLFSLPTTITSDGGHSTHDVSGLIGQYAHGNEPSHHIIYLNNYAGQAYKTQELIPQVIESQYLNKPDGLSGNDDCGQMSAWYVFSSLGFYPVNPASGVFDIGVPSYKYAAINLGRKQFIIKALNLSNNCKYIKQIRLNGKIVRNYQITYSDIMKGGVLEFEMISKPNSEK